MGALDNVFNVGMFQTQLDMSETEDWEGWQWETVDRVIEDHSEMVTEDKKDEGKNTTEETVDSDISTAGVEDSRIVTQYQLLDPGWRKTKLPDLEDQLLSEEIEDEFLRKFQVGSLVWAKVSRHRDPAWPARVTSVGERRGLELDYRVTFYGTREWAVVEESELWPYDSNTEERFCEPQFLAESRKRIFFLKAVRDIQLELQKTDYSLPRVLTVIQRQKRFSPVRMSVVNPAGLSQDVNSNLRQMVNRNTSRHSKWQMEEEEV